MTMGMFDPDDWMWGGGHHPKCQCDKCLEKKRAHEEMIKDMTWEDYGKSIVFDENDVPRGTK